MMKGDRVVACFGHVEDRIARKYAGDPLLLGIIHGNTPTASKTLVQSCEYQPIKAAWMAGSYIVGDGALHMITPVDPLLFLVPNFPPSPEQAFGELHFCDMEELFVSHVPLSCKFISRTIEASQLKNICDFKASGEELYYRFNFHRIVAWLQCKAEQTLRALQTHCPHVLTHDPESDMMYAATMVTEHLSLEWEAHLVKSLGLVACSSRPQKRTVCEQPKSPKKHAKVETTVVLSSQQKALLSREASKAAAFSKVAQGSAKIASFFTKR